MRRGPPINGEPLLRITLTVTNGQLHLEDELLEFEVPERVEV